MTCSVPLSIRCTEIAADWHFLVRKINIFHESVNGKTAARVIVSIATLGVQAPALAGAQLEKVRTHCLEVEKQMYSIQRKIKSLAADPDILSDELTAALDRQYDEPQHTIPATLAGEDLDMTLAMFAMQIFVMNGKNPSELMARSYEDLCLRAYSIPGKTHKIQPRDKKSFADNAKAVAFGVSAPLWIVPVIAVQQIDKRTGGHGLRWLYCGGGRKLNERLGRPF